MLWQNTGNEHLLLHRYLSVIISRLTGYLNISCPAHHNNRIQIFNHKEVRKVFHSLKSYIVQPYWHYECLKQNLNTPCFNEVEKGVLVSRQSICMSVSPSVYGWSHVHSVSSTKLAGSISYLYILSSNFRRCAACKGIRYKSIIRVIIAQWGILRLQAF